MRIQHFIYSQGSIAILCALAFALFAGLLYTKYQTGTTELQQQIDPTFRTAINEELESRFSRSSEVFIYSKGTPTDPGNDIYAHIQEYQTDTLRKEDAVIYGDFEQLIKQYHLKKLQPLSADSLNFYFNKSMRRMGMNVHTEVEITQLSTQTTTASGKSFNRSNYSYHSEPLIIDVKHEMQVQGFAKFPLLVILLHGEWNAIDFLGIGILLGIFTGIGFILSRLHLEKKQKNVRTLRIGNLTFDVVRRKLYSNSEEVEVRAQLAKLIVLFLEAPEHLLTKEEIKLHFWPKSTYQTDSKMHNLIASLRTLCKMDPSIRIESISQKGYQLIW